MISKPKATAIANATTDAYSFDRYGLTEWRKAARMMAARGFSERQIAVVLRSKWMRWAADAASKAKNATAADLERYFDVHLGSRLPKHLADLVFEETGIHEITDGIILGVSQVPQNGADLAGACTGEDIADLIDFAKAVRDDASKVSAADCKIALDVLRDRAKVILARIQDRTK
jgi:hypothetical protein